MDNGKNIILLGFGIYVIINMILWYKGKMTLSDTQKKRREQLLSEHNELIKVIITIVIVSFAILLSITILKWL